MNTGYMSLDELSDYIGVSKSSLYKRIEAGEIPAHKVGRYLRFSKEEIDSWVKYKVWFEQGRTGHKDLRFFGERITHITDERFEQLYQLTGESEGSAFFGGSDLPTESTFFSAGEAQSIINSMDRFTKEEKEKLRHWINDETWPYFRDAIRDESHNRGM